MNEELVYYKLTFNGDYVSGFYSVRSNENYDYYGQLGQYPDLLDSSPEGWYTFIPGRKKGEGEFILDSARKEAVIEERIAKALEPTDFDRVEAQATYTALMTDTLLPEEEEE